MSSVTTFPLIAATLRSQFWSLLPAVQDLLKKYVRVQLYTDSVPDPRLSRAEAKIQAIRNAKFRDTIGNPSNPYYFVFRPDKNEPFTAEGVLKGQPLDQRSGTIRDVDDFTRFLKQPLEKQIALIAPAP